MDVQYARFVYEVQRVAGRVSAQFEEARVVEVPGPRLPTWRSGLSVTLHRLANRLDAQNPYAPRLV